ncbi:WW domain protein [Metarhizium rileyi]|uniref:WW domain protein n=1 Tax=Metarhizium rileyi (strain RCEF 4871) TaxID=1649241 RepID=A0A162KFN2_METRR|nr:WW domain protein [Metarhizium rileyi RCEF 4871]
MGSSPSPDRTVAEEPGSRPPVDPASAQDVADKVPHDAAPAKPDHPDVEEASFHDDAEEGEVDEGSATSLQAESVPDGPPLPQEQPPVQDDGWDCQWDPSSQAWFFHNRFTGKTQWDNPRVPSTDSGDEAATPQPSAPRLPTEPPVSGYNPAVHGDYDPNAWYAQKYNQTDEVAGLVEVPSLEDGYTAAAGFNRFTGQFQTEDMGPARHTDEAKSRRQMNAFFDVDAAANTDEGRSLKAERAHKRISKSELKAFKEKRRARKEEKRRAWLKD